MNQPYDAIQAAFDTAAKEFKRNVKDEALYNEMLQIQSIDHVYDATDKLQEEQAAKSDLRHLAKIDPFLTRLSDYREAIGVFVQTKPDILALIWGPIVLLLQWASVLKKSFDAIVNTTAEIGQALPEFKRAVQLFSDNDKIKDVLLLFFRDLLDFYAIAFRCFGLSRK